MSRLIPFNHRKGSLMPAGFGSFYNMLDDFFKEDFPVARNLMSDTFKIDLKEDEKNYYVEADLPGVKKEEIKVSLDDGRLRISVEHEEKEEERDKEKNFLHQERRYCSMERNILLKDVDEAGVKAALSEGVLTLTLPKRERQETSKTIAIE